MHVCHLIHHLANGGLEQQILELVRHGGDGVDYTIYYFDEDDSLADDFRAEGGNVVNAQTSHSGPRAVFDPRVIRNVAQFLHRQSVDILHVHTPLYIHGIGRLAAALGGPDHVVGTYHNRQRNFHPTMRVLERVTRPLSSINVGVSKAVERSFTGSATEYGPADSEPVGRSCTIQNGIDVKAFRATISSQRESLRQRTECTDDVIFLNVGRYTPQKAQIDLIRAMEWVIEEVPTSHLFIVGWGQLKGDLRQAIRERDLQDHITVTGKVPTTERYYSVADVFVLSSIREGLPIVLLEAMAAKLPIVATDVSGIPEVITHRETGLLVPPKSPSELATAMIEASSKDRRERLGNRGYQRALEQFDVRRTSDSYISLYRSLLSE